MRSWKLGTAFGIGIYVHWTFLLLAAYVLFHNYSLAGADLALYSLALLNAVFGCVVLHELGHALAARRFGIPTRDITLYPIGGVARLERMSERPWEEFWIAVAGPAVNVVIALFLWLVLPLGGLLPGAEAVHQLGRGNLLLDLMVVNGFLVLFNILPIFPMDGGRVLRALLSLRLGRLRATEWAVAVGVVLAALLGFVGLLIEWYMLLVVIAFVFFAGQQELAAVRYSEARRQAEPVDVIPVEAEVLDVIPVPSEQAFSGLAFDARIGAWVVWRNGRPVQAYWPD